MKKVFALAFVAAMVTLASCGEKKTEAAADSTATTVDSAAAAPADSAAADSAAADTAAAK